MVFLKYITNLPQILLIPWLRAFNRPQQIPGRRYDLDWLRVLAFALLIFYHTGMLYSQNWGFHFKSQYLSGGVEDALLLLNPWRMALIWFISGVALRFISSRLSMAEFLVTRSVKILLPLLVGVWLIVPVQLYAQMSQNSNLTLSYWQFYGEFFDLTSPLFIDYPAGIWPHVDVNHLWYLRSLWEFTLILVLLLPLLHSESMQRILTWCSAKPVLVIVLVLLIPLCGLALNWPSDTVRYPMGLLFLLYGYLLAFDSGFWQRLQDHLKPLSILFCIGYGLVLLGYHTIWQNEAAQQWQITLFDILYTTQRLVGVLLMLALAQRFLNHNHALLPSCNAAVFPFYLLHQSVIIALAYWLSPLQLGGSLEALLIISATFVLCWLFYKLIRRIEFFGPLFGLKPRKHYRQWQINVGYGVGGVLVSPLILELLF